MLLWWGIVFCILCLGALVMVIYKIVDDKKGSDLEFEVTSAVILGFFSIVCFAEYSKEEKTVECREYRVEEVTTVKGDSVSEKTYVIHYRK